jgi:CheY-like chemotaxis protein
VKEADSVVFVVDDDSSVREAIKSLIKSVGLRVETFETAQQFLQSKRLGVPGCVVLDVRLPGLSGLDLQRELAAHDITLPIIFITGYGDIPMSVSAMKAGALEFLTKPFRDQGPLPLPLPVSPVELEGTSGTPRELPYRPRTRLGESRVSSPKFLFPDLMAVTGKITNIDSRRQ